MFLIHLAHFLLPVSSFSGKTWEKRHLETAVWTLLLLRSHLSRVQLCATPWTAAHQAPLSMGFSGQEYWSGVLVPSPGDLPDPGMEPASLVSPPLGSGFFTTSLTKMKSEWSRVESNFCCLSYAACGTMLFWQPWQTDTLSWSTDLCDLEGYVSFWKV